MSTPSMSDGERLIRVETIVENLDKKIDKIIDDHEGRIRSLEKLVWRASGAATVIGALGGGLIGYLTKYLGG